MCVKGLHILVISRLMRVLTDKMALWGSTVTRSKLKARQVRVLDQQQYSGILDSLKISILAACVCLFFLPSLRAVQGSDQRRGLRRSAERRTSRPEGRSGAGLAQEVVAVPQHFG